MRACTYACVSLHALMHTHAHMGKYAYCALKTCSIWGAQKQNIIFHPKPSYSLCAECLFQETDIPSDKYKEKLKKAENSSRIIA